MLKHPRIGRRSSCIRSGACLASTSRDGLQKEAPNSGYRVTESDERARSVTERRQYHRVVPGRPHNAQTSTHWPSFIVHTLWSVSRFNVQSGLQKEAPNSGYRVTESDERARSVTERRQYHRVVPGRPHNAQTSTHWPSFIVHTLWSVSRFNVQTAPEGGSEQWISRHGVG